MENTIKDQGGIVQRVFEALNGFRTKFGYWPNTLEAPPEVIAVLATHGLTPLGFHILQSKLELVINYEMKILAKGKSGDVFDYGEEGWSLTHEHSAIEWLGLR